jgi:hypothetical protein
MTSHRIIKDIYSLGDFSAESYNSAEQIAHHVFDEPTVQEIVNLDVSLIDNTQSEEMYI